MIGKLTGVYGGTSEEGSIIIEVAGVGYCVRMPAPSLEQLARAHEGQLTLFIHTAVREDAIDLYGFILQDELAFFKQLMSVSGIGPKSALGILSASDVMSLRRAIAKGDAAALTKVYGVGKKSAERIVVELRDKMALSKIAAGDALGAPEDGEVIEALLSLGYSASEARAALKNAVGGTTRERLASALRALGSKTPA